METATDIGTHSVPFTFRDTVDTSEYPDDFRYEGDSFTARDVFYKLRLESSMEICVWRGATPDGANAQVYWLDEYGEVELASPVQTNGYNTLVRYPGTYYLVVQLRPSRYGVSVAPEGELELKIDGTPREDGEDFYYPSDLGSFGADFTRSVSVPYFSNYKLDYNLTGDNDLDPMRHDMVHRFRLSVPMEVTLDNCGSGHGLDEPYNYQRSALMSSPQDSVPIAESSYACGKTEGRLRYVLPEGEYYVYSWGEYWSTGWNLEINLEGKAIAEGCSPLRPADLGERDTDFRYSRTVDTSAGIRSEYGVKRGKEAYFRICLTSPMALTAAEGYTDAYCGSPANDVFYKIVLRDTADLRVSHRGSAVERTRLTLLSSDGSTALFSVTSLGGEPPLLAESLPGGTYYAVSEGESSNGFITTTIEARGEAGSLSVTESQPHVVTLVPTVACADASKLGAGEARVEVQYFDRFGNPELKAERGVSPYGDDLYTLREHDGLNREVRSWLPVTLPEANGSYFSPGEVQEAVKGFAAYGGDGRPYSETVLDGSELGEVSEELGPGEDWHDGGRSVRLDRLTNLCPSDASRPYPSSVHPSRLVVRMYRVEGDSLLCSGEYPTGRLSALLTTDEDGNETYEFTDRADGRVILSRQVNGDEFHDTYTVYDGFGNVRFVLPPAAADALSAEGAYAESDDALRKYAYVYRYDDRNRMVYKHLPGAEPIYTVYDGADRPVFTQDGEQRERGEWSFSIPDAYGRIALTGTCENVLDYTANPLGDSVVTAKWASATNALKGYKVTGVTLTSPTVLAANYYDGYGFLGLNGIPNDATTAYEAVEGYGERYDGGCRGQLTGVWRASLGDGSLPAYDVSYYDNRYRMVQRRGVDGDGGRTATCTAYSFTGQPLRVKRTQGENTETLTYAYDNAERLLTVDYSLNGGEEERLVDNVYDEIGRLISERRNGNAKLKTDYAYNVRSWITGINGPLFAQTLRYQESFAGSEPRFNGNISCAQWKSGNSTARKGYRFAYDGNQLLAVRDNATNGVYGNGMEFKDGASAAVEYEYDKNGNLTKDLNRNISDIEYNCLNLPSKVTFANGNTVKYEYAADGTKLRAVHTINGVTTTTDYRGNAVYENGELKMLLNEAGYVSFPDRKFHFYIKDHQGNVRVVADAEGNVEEVNDYYPFGGLMSSATANGFQPYKYNGKEPDREAGLDLYDYGKRFYDPAIGRFTTNDRFAEKYYGMSPYQYGANNPILNVDVNGDSIRILPNPNGFIEGITYKFGIETEYQKRVKADLQQLKKDDPMIADIITHLEKSEQIHDITMPPEGSTYGNATKVNEQKTNSNIPQGSVIEYDPMNLSSNEGERTPRVGLAHELTHSYDFDKGIYDSEKVETGVEKGEIRAINVENKVRIKTNDKKRTSYGKQKIPKRYLW